MPRAVERRALDLFEEWLEHDPDGRAGLVARTSADDPDLSQALLRLINAHGQADLIPTVPAAPVDPRALAKPPERIGPWRLTGVIGQGGMGTVWRAERADGLFAQTAAIKLLRPGLFSARSERQFARERGILASLHHPNIARLFDGGTSEDGLSYFVMELIEGVPITRFCADQSLPLKDRVALLSTLCEAVEYAHQQLVVHADIKPGNVLVAPTHGVKLLDFGISRLSGETDEGAPRSGHSPHYASPQLQAGERAVAADDIFAIGALLENLLEGHTPDADLAAVAARASAPDPAQRYGSVGALRDDLQRWLAGFPVRAIPQRPMRDFAAFFRRHSLAVTATALGAMALVALAVTSTILYRRAEARFAETRALSRFLLDDVVTGIEPLPGSGEMRRHIAERARGSLERLSQVPGASDELLVDLGEAYARVGLILTASDLREGGNSGALGAASLAHAAGLLRARLVEEPDRTDLWLVLAQTLAAHARYGVDQQSDLDAAQALLEQARQALDRAGSAPGLSWDRLMTRLDIAIAESSAAYDRTDWAVMEQAARTGILTARTARPASDNGRVQLALRLDQLWATVGDARWYGHDDKRGALAAYDQSGAALDAAAAIGDIRIVQRQAYAAFNRASTMFELGRETEALAMMEQALEQVRRMRLFDNSVDARHQEAVVLMEYAMELEAVHRIPEARRHALQSIAVRRSIIALEPNSYAELRALPIALRTTGQLFYNSGDRNSACIMFREANTRLADLARREMLTEFDRTGVGQQIEDWLTECRS